MRKFLAAALLAVTSVTSVTSVTIGAAVPADAGRPPWFVDESKLPFTPLADAQALWGVHAGAGYRIEVPANWNGDLVLYARVYRGEGPELTVTNSPIRNHLVAEGYAWAASSYRANGYVPGTGAQDTHRLLQRVGALVGRPDRVYLTGSSMGGHVTGVAIEQWPKSFDGAQPECGGPGREDVETVYQFDADPALTAEEQAFNDLIVRIAAEPQYRHRNGLGGQPGGAADSPAISGDISVPVISTHTLGELFVPFHMEQIHAERVAANGASDLLVSRAIRDIFRCSFRPAERIAAFDDLVTWVETGVRPAGDDVLDPATVADPNFGCQFTEPDRPYLPACP